MSRSLVAYVDGFNLYNGVKEAFAHRYLWLDLVALLQQFRPKSQIVEVNFFTARVLDDPDALSRQDTYIAALEAAHPDVVKIHMGRYQPLTRSCKDCGSEWTSYEEKETDVNIALAIARDALQRPEHDFFLISGDSDAAPAIREAQRLNPNGFYSALFPPKRSSEELRRLMPSSASIGEPKLRTSQLPETVTDADGSSLVQPSKWRRESFLEDGGEKPALKMNADGSRPTPALMARHKHS